jgi:hypothetical protein
VLHPQVAGVELHHDEADIELHHAGSGSYLLDLVVYIFLLLLDLLDFVVSAGFCWILDLV